MSSRKHATTTPDDTTDKEKTSKTTRDNNLITTFGNPHFLYALSVFFFLSLWLLLLLRWFPPPKAILQYIKLERKHTTNPTCDAAPTVYVYDLPSEFNLGLLDNCRHLNMFRDMCPHVANRGLGQRLSHMGSASWFATNQFTAEMLFHARVDNHPCRTRDPARADLFLVPFYGGLYASSKFRESDFALRDELVVRLVAFLEEQPWWRRRGGRDHFVVLGRIAWDFMRTPGGTDYGASSLLTHPPLLNMSALIVERHPWKGARQHGIPYPSYFHPSTSDEMLAWQNQMRVASRPHLFSFVGAPRTGLKRAAIRNEVIRQCAESSRCKLFKCGHGTGKCDEPREVLKVMMGSTFCLQVLGDSFTRRSTFDSILAGCIPVFFSPHTAYTQYSWFLPEDRSAYSVYIEGKGNSTANIEEELVKISAETVERMRRTVVDLIPTLTYAHPNATDFGFRDAVDVALEALAKHVGSKL